MYGLQVYLLLNVANSSTRFAIELQNGNFLVFADACLHPGETILQKGIDCSDVLSWDYARISRSLSPSGKEGIWQALRITVPERLTVQGNVIRNRSTHGKCWGHFFRDRIFRRYTAKTFYRLSICKERQNVYWHQFWRGFWCARTLPTQNNMKNLDRMIGVWNATGPQ